MHVVLSLSLSLAHSLTHAFVSSRVKWWEGVGVVDVDDGIKLFGQHRVKVVRIQLLPWIAHILSHKIRQNTHTHTHTQRERERESEERGYRSAVCVCVCVWWCVAECVAVWCVIECVFVWVCYEVCGRGVWCMCVAVVCVCDKCVYVYVCVIVRLTYLHTNGSLSTIVSKQLQERLIHRNLQVGARKMACVSELQARILSTN